MSVVASRVLVAGQTLLAHGTLVDITPEWGLSREQIKG